jgi:hypothetical protein
MANRSVWNACRVLVVVRSSSRRELDDSSSKDTKHIYGTRASKRRPLKFEDDPASDDKGYFNSDGLAALHDKG